MSNLRNWDKPPPYSLYDSHGSLPGVHGGIQQPGYSNGNVYTDTSSRYPSAPQMPVNGAYVPQYGTMTTVVSDHFPQEIIIVGACPACRVGVLEDDYTCLGVFCAIFFFPLGILLCLALKNRRCSNCGAVFG